MFKTQNLEGKKQQLPPLNTPLLLHNCKLCPLWASAGVLGVKEMMWFLKEENIRLTRTCVFVCVCWQKPILLVYNNLSKQNNSGVSNTGPFLSLTSDYLTVCACQTKTSGVSSPYAFIVKPRQEVGAFIYSSLKCDEIKMAVLYENWKGRHGSWKIQPRS